jgi:hypothetical protein
LVNNSCIIGNSNFVSNFCVVSNYRKFNTNEPFTVVKKRPQWGDFYMEDNIIWYVDRVVQLYGSPPHIVMDVINTTTQNKSQVDLNKHKMVLKHIDLLTKRVVDDNKRTDLNNRRKELLGELETMEHVHDLNKDSNVYTVQMELIELKKNIAAATEELLAIDDELIKIGG